MTLLTRRQALAVLGLGAAGGCSSGRSAVARGVDYLLSQQDPDGAWRSRTYGLLSGGDSLTAFILNALLDLPGVPPAALSAGLDFLRSRMRPDGAVGMVDPSLSDYPNYSTAFTLRALIRIAPSGWPEQADRITAWLRGQQFSEANGWSPADPPYGGWGMGGAPHRPPEPGHVDLSMTRHVAAALRAAGACGHDPALVRTHVFLDRCRNPDGGFSFSPVVPEANKAGARDRRYLSYGTASADGLRLLLALDAPDDHIARARAWLAAHHLRDAVPGFDRHPDLRWRDGLWYYYVASAAEFLPDPLRAELVQTLRQRQRPDGSWSNPEPLVKEDDPLIATPFALRAFAAGGPAVA